MSGRVNQFFNVGFHGDKYLLDLVDCTLRDAEVFIETGANVGSTVAYVAQKYRHIVCLSCEPDPSAYSELHRAVAGMQNVQVHNESSQEFMGRIRREMTHLFTKRCVFWLDAHGFGYPWPLREEVAFFTGSFSSGSILVDDFRVPGMDQFRFDSYDGQVCSYEYIEGSLSPEKQYRIVYPSYTDRTSNHHPLCGWVLIAYGVAANLVINPSLQDKIWELWIDTKL